MSLFSLPSLINKLKVASVIWADHSKCIKPHGCSTSEWLYLTWVKEVLIHFDFKCRLDRSPCAEIIFLSQQNRILEGEKVQGNQLSNYLAESFPTPSEAITPSKGKEHSMAMKMTCKNMVTCWTGVVCFVPAGKTDMERKGPEKQTKKVMFSYFMCFGNSL